MGSWRVKRDTLGGRGGNRYRNRLTPLCNRSFRRGPTSPLGAGGNPKGRPYAPQRFASRVSTWRRCTLMGACWLVTRPLA